MPNRSSKRADALDAMLAIIAGHGIAMRNVFSEVPPRVDSRFRETMPSILFAVEAY
ncbi:MAG: hypothetical protein LBU32_05115 [Clostridiales bacterium]|jgi:hypothetical protein|nr:hypothetical protein [Clostridiales bacterium]